MMISQKCNCCVHDPICSFKPEYLSACEAIKGAAYSTGDNGRVMMIKDSKIDVNIKCPHMMTASMQRA